jgi:hypothetical protein
MSSTEQRQICTRCKMNLTLDKFTKKRDDSYQKGCNECNRKKAEYTNKAKCEHGRQRNQCRDCGGGSICTHDRLRSQCRDCGGCSICEHGRRRAYCKDCKGSRYCEHDLQIQTCKICTDPVDVTICKWLNNARTSDKEYNRYDADFFIDRCFLEALIENDGSTCYYCATELQYIEFGGNQATIERISNDIGHIKSNVVIACHSCNVGRVGQRLPQDPQ